MREKYECITFLENMHQRGVELNKLISTIFAQNGHHVVMHVLPKNAIHRQSKYQRINVKNVLYVFFIMSQSIIPTRSTSCLHKQREYSSRIGIF